MSGRAWLLRKLRLWREDHGAYPGPRDLPELLRRLGGLIRRSCRPAGDPPVRVPRAADRVDASKLGVRALALVQPLGGGAGPGPWVRPWAGLAARRRLRAHAALARQYGLGGFCFEATAASGPLRTLLRDPGLNMGFCLCWDSAGGPAVEAMLPALLDPRQIRVQGKPMALVRAALDSPRAEGLRQAAQRAGLPGLHLLAVGGEGAQQVGVGPTPEHYSRALALACAAAPQSLVLIHAWGARAQEPGLEPDRDHGHAYLHATASALRQHHRDPGLDAALADLNNAFAKRSDAALVFHCHYEDLLEPMARRCRESCGGMDVFLSFKPDVSLDFLMTAARLFPHARFLRLENRGRDMRPFLVALAELRRLGYRYGCKIHSKRSLHLKRGDAWREKLLDALLPDAASVRRTLGALAQAGGPGLMVAPDSLMDCGVPERHLANVAWLDVLLRRMGREDLVGNYRFQFPAGSMFWFKVEALAGLDDLGLAGDPFEPEVGQLDSTLAHALERVVGVYAAGRGFPMALAGAGGKGRD